MLRRRRSNPPDDAVTTPALEHEPIVPPSSLGWKVFRKVMTFSLLGGCIGVAVRLACGQQNFLIALWIHYLTIFFLMPLGALFGLIESTRQHLFQSDGPVVRELERRWVNIQGRIRKAKSLKEGTADDTPSLEESQEAAQNVYAILNTLTSGYAYSCIKFVTSCFLPSSKVMFQQIDRIAKNSSTVQSSTQLLVSFCDTYLETWQYRLAFIAAIVYGLCVAAGTVLSQLF